MSNLWRCADHLRTSDYEHRHGTSRRRSQATSNIPTTTLTAQFRCRNCCFLLTACAIEVEKPSSTYGNRASPRDRDAKLMGGYYEQNQDSRCKCDDGVGRLLTG